MSPEADFSDSYEEIQEKLNKLKESETKDTEVDDKEFSTPEKDADIDFENMTDEEPEFLTRRPEEEEIEEEEIVEKETKKETKEATGEEEKIKDDLIQYLEESGGTKYRVKGKEYDLKDLSPQEIKDRFSKAGRFYQAMEELSRERQKIEQDRILLDQAARLQMRNLGTTGSGLGKTEQVKVPNYLEPGIDDSEEVKSLKEGMKTLLTEVNNLKMGVQSQAYQSQESQFFNEIDRLKADYPAASIDEVIALKSVRPDIPTEKLMEASHRYYSSPKFVEGVLESNPELKREITEKLVTEFKAKEQKTKKKISRKRSGTAASTKVSEKETKVPKTWDEAKALSMAYLKEVSRAEEE